MSETMSPPRGEAISKLKRWLKLDKGPARSISSAAAERLIDLNELTDRISAIREDRMGVIESMRRQMREDYRESLVRRSLSEYLKRLLSPGEGKPAFASMPELLELTGYARLNGLYQAIGRGAMRSEKVMLIIDTYGHLLPFPNTDRLKLFAVRCMKDLALLDPAAAAAPKIGIDRYLMDWIYNLGEWWAVRETSLPSVSTAVAQHERICGFVKEDRASGFLYDGEGWDRSLDDALFNDRHSLYAYYWYWRPSYTVWCDEFRGGRLL